MARTRVIESDRIDRARSRLAAGAFVCFSLFASAARADDSGLENGNAAVRAGRYEEALVWFDTARRDGGDNALLSYDRGVAEYRLHRYAEAETSFAAASNEPRLRARAFYNLGLVHLARGEKEDALGWFRQVAADATAAPDLRALAQKAVGKTRPPPPRVASGTMWDANPKRASDFFTWGFATQLATDSNIYSSPSSSYTDLSQPGTPVVTPKEESGLFVPVQLYARADWGRFDWSRFHAGYSFSGDFYTDPNFSNANRQSHEFWIGNTYNKDSSIGRIYLDSSFTIARHVENAFDPDDGSRQFVNGVDVSDRDRYYHYEPRVRFADDIGNFRFGVTLDGHVDNYDETTPATDYSHTQGDGEVDLSYKLFGKTRIGIDYSMAVRDYETYPSADRNGTRFTLAPAVTYQYMGGGAFVRQPIGSSAWVGIEYRLTDRTDEYVGYDDYRRQSIGARAHFKLWRVVANVAYAYNDYSFPNAFAFDVPTGGDKTLSAHEATLDAQMWLWRTLYLTANVHYETKSSSDPRLEYQRNLAAIGLKWVK